MAIKHSLSLFLLYCSGSGSSTKRNPKPSTSGEKKMIRKNKVPRDNPSNICGVCMGNYWYDDHGDSERWIQCPSSFTWFHETCTGCTGRPCTTLYVTNVQDRPRFVVLGPRPYAFGDLLISRVVAIETHFLLFINCILFVPNLCYFIRRYLGLPHDNVIPSRLFCNSVTIFQHNDELI